MLPIVCLLAVTYAAVPMDMRGPGDEMCSGSVHNPCDESSTHCVQIKYYLAAWEYDEPDVEADKHKKAIVCMCKRGYTPDPNDEMKCRNCEVGEECHEGDMNPPRCGHNSCDYYSTHCVPDVDSFLGFNCECQDNFVPNPYNPLKCSFAPYVNVKGHKVTTVNGDVWSGSYGEEQYAGEYVDATRDAHVDGASGGHVATGAHQYVASTSEDYMPGTDFFSENSAATAETVSPSSKSVPLVAAIGGGVGLVALAVVATFLSRKTAAATETAEVPALDTLTPSNAAV